MIDESIGVQMMETIKQKIADQARDALVANQECFVAQWILQNPDKQISDYRLKFTYNDQTRLGYMVEMEKIDVQ